MKKTYYGVFFEYYKNGDVKSGIILVEKTREPVKAKTKRNPICTAYEFWFSDLTSAEELKTRIDRLIKTKKAMFYFFLGFTSEAAA
jgi:hypothetical protein